MAAAGVLTAFADNSTNTSGGAAPAVTPEMKYPWESSVSVGLSLTRGNSDTTLFSADFLTKRKTPANEYQFGLGGAYGDQNSKETSTTTRRLASGTILFTERFFGYVRTDGCATSLPMWITG